MVTKNQQFSHGTLNPNHLLEIALPYVESEPLLAPLAGDIRDCLRAEGDAMELWDEVVRPYLEGLAPEGCAFGCTEGDGSDLGWWEVPEGDW